MDRGETHGTGGPDHDARVVRPPRPASARSGPRLAIAAAVVVAIVLGAGAVVASLGGTSDPPAELAEVRAEVTVAPSSTVAPTTTEPQPDGPVAPLTGIRHFAIDAERLAQPALVAKVDNDAKALPQRGLESADVVLEVRVEGISRFMAVFHSRIPAEIGPIRSARTSDPDLLSMFSDPMFSWSGGNPATVSQLRDVPWVRNVDPDTIGRVYSRSQDRRAPHNLILDAPALVAGVETDSGAPGALFAYRSDGEEPAGSPTAGFDVSVGSSVAGFAWSAERAGWLRWTNGVVHTDPGGQQLAPANVVVLETDYVASPADRRSPEAVTLGSGSAWIFTAGQVIEGTWRREDRHQPWTLTSTDGAPVLLTPGSTWVELPAVGDPPTLLAAG